MTRRASRISHDEVCRMVKAVQKCGLHVGQVVFNGDEVRVVIGGDIGEKAPPMVDEGDRSGNFDDLEDYLAWRDKERVGGG